MKTKRIRIKTKSKFFDETLEQAAAIDRGESIEPVPGEYFESLEAVRTVLTEKRLGLWRLIRDQNPDSILDLAKRSNRDFKSVYRDVMVLVSVGLIALIKQKGRRGDIRKPKSLADRLRLDVA